VRAHSHDPRGIGRGGRLRRWAALALLAVGALAALGSPGAGEARAASPGAKRAEADPLEAMLAERRALVERQPNQASAWIALGDLLALVGRVEEAEQAYRTVLALDPVAGHFHLGRLHAGAGRRFAARRELALTLELAPGHAAAHYELGTVYDAWDLDRLARKHFTRAFALDPSLADPAVNPLVTRNRQAFAALVASWDREPALAPPPPALAAAPRSAGEERPEPAAPDSPATLAPGESSGGGYARSTGGGAADGSRPTVGRGGAPIALDEDSLRSSGGREGSAETGGRVLSPGSLGGGSVNQIVPPGGASRSGRGSSRRPVLSPPREPEPSEPFDPFAESTGRVERRLDPASAGQLSLGAEQG
jgi:tetratricopeptide (TPR) repeat protein